MRHFARLLEELKDIAKTQRPGDVLPRPNLLHSVSIQGRILSYFHMGNEADGPPVICIHGFGGYFMDWPRIMAPLARHRPVYAIDLPGWGFSEPHREIRGIEDDAHVVSQFIAALGLRDVTLVGLSYGAGVAWAAAALKSPHVRELLLLNPMPPHPLRFIRSPLYKAIFALNRFKPAAALGHRAFSRAQFKMICKENLRHYRLVDSFYLELGYLVLKQPHVAGMLHAHASGAATVDWDEWIRHLARIEVPVTILQGKNDRIFSLKSALFLRDRIPGARLFEIADCGHAMIFDQHRRVIDHLSHRKKAAPDFKQAAGG